MTSEEVTQVIAYCEENKVSYKQQLDELGIAAWMFYDAKRKCAPKREADNAGDFLQLVPGETFFPSPIKPARSRSRENAIRPLALGLKNYLFCGSHDVAIRAAIVYSLVNSCKAMGIDPREWMEDVLLRISGNENNRTALRELLPVKWAKQSI